MFDWLFDDRWVIALILGLAAIGCVFAWWRTRRKQYLYGLAAVVVLAAVYALFCMIIVTDAQQMELRTKEIAGSVKSGQIKTVLDKNLADDFNVQGFDKRRMIEKAESIKSAFGVESITVWDFKVMELDRDKGTATISFRAKPIISTQETPFYRVEADYVMTPAEHWWQKPEWKLKTFRYFQGFVDSKDPLPIP